MKQLAGAGAEGVASGSAAAQVGVVQTFYGEVLSRGRTELLHELIAPAYQPHVARFAQHLAPAAGREALIERLRAAGPLALEVKRCIVDGDFVFAHVKYAGTSPLAGCDIFEFDAAGRICAHWNIRQPISGSPEHIEEYFADAPGLESGPPWPREALRKRIRAMLEELWAKGDSSLVPDFYSPAYVQHNPDMPGGFKRIQEVVERDIRAYIRSAGTPFPIELHRIGVQGDLAFVYLSIFMAGINRNDGDRSTNVDIFRVNEAGLMIEHWDVLQMSGEALPSAASIF